jgi:hypothetical protein
MTKSVNSDGHVTRLKAAIKSRDESAIFEAAVAAGDAGSAGATSTLLQILKSDLGMRAKNGAAIAVRELRVSEAVPHLIRLIEDSATRGKRGTLVYALQTLDWYSKHTYAVARLLTDDNYEVRVMAFQALRDAASKMTRDQKDGMLSALLLRLAALSRSRKVPSDLQETIEAVLPLLVKKTAIRAAQPALVA